MARRNGSAARRKKFGSKSLSGRPSRDVNTTSFMGQVGAKIRRLRLDRNMTLDELAAMTNGVLTGSMLSQYEVGDMEPRISKFIALCVALDVGLSDLLPDQFVRAMILRDCGGDDDSFDDLKSVLLDVRRPHSMLRPVRRPMPASGASLSSVV